MPKVSVLVPVYNVAKFLEQCLDSLAKQTLTDIEIICINDGSTDNSLEILQAYAAKYPTFNIIDKENGGYGKAMNAGLDMATGDYIGIVESDDFCNKNMFEVLYQTATEHSADAVKSNYFRYISFPSPKDSFMNALGACEYNKVFTPREDTEIFYASPSIWSGLYKRSFLKDNNIRFTETPGASFQDTAFNFKVWACTERAVAIRAAFLHYRVDNENSSVKSRGKVDYVNYEFAEIERFLAKRPNLYKALTPTKNALKFGTYDWNLKRLSSDLRYEYFQKVCSEFKAAQASGELEEKTFSKQNWEKCQALLANPEAYYRDQFGPRNSKVCFYVAVEGPADSVTRSLESLKAQTSQDATFYLLPHALSAAASKAMRNTAKGDSRFVVLGYRDYAAGELSIAGNSEGYSVFMKADTVLPKSCVELLLSKMETESLLVAAESAQHGAATAPATASTSALQAICGGQHVLLVAASNTHLAGLPVSPYSIDVCAAAVALSQAPEANLQLVKARSIVTSTFTPKTSSALPPATEYKRLVDDFRCVQKYCGAQLQSSQNYASYLRWSYKKASWLKNMYKLMLEGVRSTLPSKYVPENFLTKVIAIHKSEHHTACSRVSVIVPIYNKEEWLAGCIESICKQTIGSVEIICVDDGSSDSSLESILELQKTNPQIIVIEQTNSGAAIARNNAMAQASGTYLAFLDADDFYPAENVLKRLCDTADATGQLVCGGTLALFYEDKKGMPKPKKGAEIDQNYVFTAEEVLDYRAHQYDYGFVRYVYNRAFIEKAGIRFPDYAWFEDPVFLVQALSTAGSFATIPDEVYAYRQTHTAKQISWPETRVCDLLRGLKANLSLSREKQLEYLHIQTLIRIEGDYFNAIKSRLGSNTVLALLLEINNTLSDDLLRQGDVYLESPHIIRPLAYLPECYKKQATLGKQKKKLQRQNKKLRRWTTVRRAVAASPRYAKKFARHAQHFGFSKAMKRGLQVAKKKAR